MRKHIILFVTIILLASGIIMKNFDKSQTIKNKEINEENVTIYTLKDYKGQLALFINNAQTPSETYNIFTNSLPKSDIENLKEGIVAKNKEELYKIFEEYLG